MGHRLLRSYFDPRANLPLPFRSGEAAAGWRRHSDSASCSTMSPVPSGYLQRSPLNRSGLVNFRISAQKQPATVTCISSLKIQGDPSTPYFGGTPTLRGYIASDAAPSTITTFTKSLPISHCPSHHDLDGVATCRRGPRQAQLRDVLVAAREQVPL
jgi:hypothetical protein